MIKPYILQARDLKKIDSNRTDGNKKLSLKTYERSSVILLVLQVLEFQTSKAVWSQYCTVLSLASVQLSNKGTSFRSSLQNVTKMGTGLCLVLVFSLALHVAGPFLLWSWKSCDTSVEDFIFT